MHFVLYHDLRKKQQHCLFVSKKVVTYLIPADWPQNEQCRAHYGEFLRGYKPSLESVETRFPFSDATRVIKPFSVCFNDGFTKVLLMMAILTFIYELAAKCDLEIHVFVHIMFDIFVLTWGSPHGCQVVSSISNVLSKDWNDDQLSHPDVDHMLKSFRWIRCSFTYFANPSHHYLHSLRAFSGFGCHRLD